MIQTCGWRYGRGHLTVCRRDRGHQGNHAPRRTLADLIAQLRR